MISKGTLSQDYLVHVFKCQVFVTCQVSGRGDGGYHGRGGIPKWGEEIERGAQTPLRTVVVEELHNHKLFFFLHVKCYRCIFIWKN